MSKQKLTSQARSSTGRAQQGDSKHLVDFKPRKSAKVVIERPSPEEDAKITAAARADPDAQPAAKLFARRGRPKSLSPKQPVLLRIDQDVVVKFKQSGEGWQTRMNDALRKAAGLK